MALTTLKDQTNTTSSTQLEAPRFEQGAALLIAGLRRSYTCTTMNDLPAQWQSFAPYIGKVSGQVGRAAYGLCFLGKDLPELEYLSGVEVSSRAGLPDEFSCVSIPAQRYAVFTHQGHVSKLRDTCDAIEKLWLPASGCEPIHAAGAPDFFERYTEDFNPRSGMGGIEVWVPIKG